MGDLVRDLEGKVEPDSPSILVHGLVIAGNALGRGPHRIVAATRHSCSEFAVIVGKSSLARKGTARDLVLEALTFGSGEEWELKSLVRSGGLSTGEGLLLALCDPESVAAGEDRRRSAVPMPGRRLCVIETEFGRVLAVGGREGNTLTGWLRALWDRGEARNLTRRNPLAVTGAHLSIVGHVTVAELRARFDPIDICNGFGNRVLWTCSRRAHRFHDGGPDLQPLLRKHRGRISRAITVGRDLAQLRWTELADAAYEAAYEVLEGDLDDETAAASLTSRSSAHVLRLSSIYAALGPQSDPRRAVVRVGDLLAALAVVRYVGDSVNCVWGGRSLDPDADRILAAVEECGELTRTGLHDLFGRNTNAARLQRAIGFLAERGLVVETKQRSGRGGRPAEVLQRTDQTGHVPLVRPWADALEAARTIAAEARYDDTAPKRGAASSDTACPGCGRPNAEYNEACAECVLSGQLEAQVPA